MAAIPVFMLFIYLVLFVIVIYALFLFIQLAQRGIKALDIYIDEKTNRRL